MKITSRLLVSALIALGLWSGAHAAWPEKPITIIVPAAPGGTADISTRLISDKLANALGTTVVVENKAGAGGIIGSQTLTRAAPDGYTLDMGNIGPNAINYSLYKKLPYRPEDFSAVTLVVAVPNVLVVNSQSPYKTVRELVDAIKKNPSGQFSFGSSGSGQSTHLSGEMFVQRTGLQAAHIPYKGAGPAVTALLGKQFTFMIDNLPSSMPYIRGGQFRALAVTSKERSPQLPDVPTMAEAGIDNMVVNAWFGLVAPAGTPIEIRRKIQEATKAVLDSPEMQERIASMGGVAGGNSPEAFQAYIDEQRSIWKPIVDGAHLSVEQ